jgi:hypothetical protein
LASSSTLTMEAAHSSEMLVIYHAIWHHIWGYSTLNVKGMLLILGN